MASASCTRVLRGDASAPAAVRRIVQRELEATGHRQAIADVQLLASELVTNAVVHTDCPECLVELECDDEHIRFSVHDCDSVRLPRLLTPDPERYGGMGLHIVNDVARCWGCDPDGRGKSVWFEVSDAPDDAGTPAS